MSRKQRSWRRLLLRPRFQLKYALVVALIGGVIFALLGLSFYSEIVSNSVLASQHPDPAVAEILREELAREDRKVLWALIAACAGLVASLLLVGIFFTHRMVGPIHVMERLVEEIAAGDAPPQRKLRRGDEFQGLHNRLMALADHLSERGRHEATVLEQCLQGLEKGEVGPARASLEDLLAARRTPE